MDESVFTRTELDLRLVFTVQQRTALREYLLRLAEDDGRVVAGAAVGSLAVVGNLFIPTPAVADDLFGWGVVYALHARACVERGRVWQAEHYVGALRDHGLSLACLREGVPAVQARGYDGAGNTGMSSTITVTMSVAPSDIVLYAAEAPIRVGNWTVVADTTCLLYTSPSPRDRQKSRMPSSA